MYKFMHPAPALSGYTGNLNATPRGPQFPVFIGRQVGRIQPVSRNQSCGARKRVEREEGDGGGTLRFILQGVQLVGTVALITPRPDDASVHRPKSRDLARTV